MDQLCNYFDTIICCQDRCRSTADKKSQPHPLRMSLKSMPLDPIFVPGSQTGEHLLLYVKGSGGCIRLTDNTVAFRCWILSGPELARLQKQFEEEYLPDDDPQNPCLCILFNALERLSTCF